MVYFWVINVQFSQLIKRNEAFTKTCDLSEIQNHNKDCDDNASKNIQLQHRLKKRIIHNCTGFLSENFLYCLKLLDENKFKKYQEKGCKRDVKLNYSLEEQLRSGKWRINWNVEHWSYFMIFKQDIFRPPLLDIPNFDPQSSVRKICLLHEVSFI